MKNLTISRNPAVGVASPVERMRTCTTTRARSAVPGMHQIPRWRAALSSPPRSYPGRVLGHWYRWYSRPSASSVLSSPPSSSYGEMRFTSLLFLMQNYAAIALIIDSLANPTFQINPNGFYLNEILISAFIIIYVIIIYLHYNICNVKSYINCLIFF